MAKNPPCRGLFQPGVLPALLGILSLSYSVELRGQSSQALLFGRVVNPSGEPLKNAVVVQRNLGTNAESAQYCNEQGLYSFAYLPPGSYSLRAYGPGLQPEERVPLQLNVSGLTTIDFTLKPAGAFVRPMPPSTAARPPAKSTSQMLVFLYGADLDVPEPLQVNLPTPVTETGVSSLSCLIDERKITELPLSGRDVYTMLVLQPGVSSDNATGRGLGFSVNGQRSASSNFLLDGVDNNDLLVTGPAARVSADAIQEYRMTTSNYTAEYGRSAGFLANAVTRSGTNSFHGTLFEFFNQRGLNANSFTNNWQGLQKEPFRQNQFGGSLGGPLRPDRLFFFGNFEQLRSSSETQPTTILVPSATLVQLAPASSQARQLWSQFPPPAGEAIPGALGASKILMPLPLVQRNTFFLGRADYNFPNEQHRLSARYAFSQQTSDDIDFSVYPSLNAPLVIRGQNVSIDDTRNLLAGTNELKFGFNRNTVRIWRPHPEIPTLFIAGPDGISLPGSEAAYDYFSRDTIFHLLDNYAWLRGEHSLKLGGEWRPGLHDSLISPARDGAYFFASIADFLLDSPFGLMIAVNRQTGLPAADSDFWRHYFQNEGAVFFQDDWKVTPRVTLNLGIRWEYFGAPSARQDTQDFNFVFGQGGSIEERIGSGELVSGKLFEPDHNNFAPRFGFALDAWGNGRTVIRGGYGVFFDRIFNNLWMDARSNSITPAVLFNFPGFTRFQYVFPARNAISQPVAVNPQSTVAVDRALRTPYSQSWFLGLQQEVTPNLVLEINQVGALGRKLSTADVINRAFSTAFTFNNLGGWFNPGQPDISYRGNQGHSDYVSVQFSLNRRWSRGVQLQASYTYSRSRDVQSDPLTGRASQQQQGARRLSDPTSFFLAGSGFTRQFDPSSDYGRSDFDQTHNFVFNLVGQVPKVGRIPRFFSGWQAGAIAGFRSGFPFSVFAENPSNADPNDFFTSIFHQPGSGVLLNNRADFLGANSGQAFLANHKEIPGGLLVLDSTKFRAPRSDEFGTSPRNAFRGPGFWNIDLSVSRTFSVARLGEQTGIQFRADLFNAFNHTNLNSPYGVLDNLSVPFGQALYGRQGFGSALPSASPLDEQPRRIQVALKFYY